MVTIPHHGPKQALFDMNTFAGDIAQFFQIDRWRIRVEECCGENAADIELCSQDGWLLSNEDFWALYRGIHQTIDGRFIAYQQGVQQCRLDAVDSSFWEIRATPEFEQHMQSRYGTYPAE